MWGSAGGVRGVKGQISETAEGVWLGGGACFRDVVSTAGTEYISQANCPERCVTLLDVGNLSTRDTCFSPC